MFGREVLSLDPAEAVRSIASAIRTQVFDIVRRRGAVLGLSGGIDSAVTAALCARALGPERVRVLFMPDRDSSAESLRLGQLVAARLGVSSVLESISEVAAAAGCYSRQSAAIQSLIPEYGEGWRCKITLPGVLESDRFQTFRLTVESPDGRQKTVRLSSEVSLSLIAATNFKQRLRKMMEYYHADKLQYAVAGTPNRLEYDQGFFVKQGDGAADFKPIAHLYKTQVYALAEYLEIPGEVCRRTPTTETYSLPQTQDEFYFALPWDRMDLCLYAINHGVPAADVAPAVGLTEAQVVRVFRDVAAKRRATHYLHRAPLLVEPVPEIHSELHP